MSSKNKLMKLFSYGNAAIQVAFEIAKALSDGVLTTKEAMLILKKAVTAFKLDIDAELIEITTNPDGGFSITFPHEAIKDWKIELF